MKINIKATNIELTETITEYLTEKINSLEKFIAEPKENIFCDAEIGKTTRHHKEGDVYRAEFNLRISGKLFRTEEECENLYAAIDKTRGEMARSIKQIRTKKLDNFRRGAAKIKNLIKGFRW